jgi:hypothetical protein
MVALRRCSIPVLLLLLSGGCSPFSVAKRGLTEVRGASGKVVPIREASPAFYRSIGRLEIGSVSNTIGPVCPPSMYALAGTALKESAAQASEKLPGAGVCTAEVDIMYHQPPGGIRALIGKGAVLLGRARLLDEHRETQADLLIGVFSEAMRTTEGELAGEFGKALAEHVRKGGGN